MGAETFSFLDGRQQSGDWPSSRGLAYGDGLFETLPIIRGELLWLEAHLRRLQAGAGRLGLTLDLCALLRELEALRQAAGCPVSGMVKITLYRRASGRGYIPARRDSERLLQLFPGTKADHQAWQQGVKLMLCQQRLARQPALAGIKHLNRLEQVLAAAELSCRAYVEGLMLDESGLLIEGTRSNVFVVSQGELLTPALDHCGVAGIMREQIRVRAAELGLAVRVAPLTLAVFMAAEEALICNSVFGIWPVTGLDCHRKAIGPVTRRLQALFINDFDV